nr:hypothetical protein [Paracoccus saliphilus]
MLDTIHLSRAIKEWLMVSRSSVRRFTVATGLCLVAAQVSAQDATSLPAPASDAAVPIEIGIWTVNSEVNCGPPELRLPPSDVFEMHLVNNSELPVMFIAQKLFASAPILEMDGSVYDATSGGFLVQPERVVEVVIRTPPVGEYYYACFNPGDQPTPKSTGFILVVPRE